LTSDVQPKNDVNNQSKLSPRLIAFYLPQFHPIPENNVWWGNGFTEWPNVVRAKPLFPGHYQPHIPADLGFYDLRIPEVRQAQADLAREYGIHGFCYYHYWFEGRQLLERPFEEVLKSGEPNIPFCLCWANQPWSWKRSINDQGRLLDQKYSKEDDREHIRWLLRAFEDERYIRVHGRPLFLVYMVHTMADPKRTFETWRQEALKAGVAEPYICKVESFAEYGAPEEFGCDAAVVFWPHDMDAFLTRVKGEGEVYEKNMIFEYKELTEKHLERPEPPFKRYPCVVPGWDNTARFKANGAWILHGSTPQLYGRWLNSVIEKVAANPPDEQIVFINAWNEWSEGTHLEPDLKHGRAYLEATRDALKSAGAEFPTNERTKTETESAPTPIGELYSDLLKKYELLQKRFNEYISSDERADLVKRERNRTQAAEKRLEESIWHYEQLRKHYEQLRQNYEELTQRHKELTQRHKELTHIVQSSQAGTIQLLHWMRQVDEGVSAILNSRRWKVTSKLTETLRRAVGEPTHPTAEDHLVGVIGEFRAWLENKEEQEDQSETATRREPTDGV
jgi:hypothetical protein